MAHTKKSLEALKKELQKRKQELEEKLSALNKEKVTDDQIQDPGDQALTSTMELLRSSFQDAEGQEYKRIVLALQKIEDGTYGICVDCENPISEKRLKMFPNASRCLVCQEAFEEGGD